MNRKRLQQVILGSAGAVVLAGGALLAAAEYQAGHEFAPTESDRALNVNQVVFPEEEKPAQGADRDKSDDSELWEKDQNADESEHPHENSTADYLFESSSQALNTPNGTQNATLNTGSSTTSAAGGVTAPAGSTATGADIVYDITEDTGSADVILNTGDGAGVSNGGNSDNGGTDNAGSGDSSTGKDDTTPVTPVTPGGDTTPPDDTPVTPDPDPDPEPKPDPVPPTPSTADRVQDPDIVKPDPGENGNLTYDESIRDQIEGTDYVFILTKWDTANSFYVGQKLTARDIYRSMDAFIRAGFDFYYFSDADYGKYVIVDAVSFDGGLTWISDFPVTVPEGLGMEDFQVKCRYRLSTAEEWQEDVGIVYEVKECRVMVLKDTLPEDATQVSDDQILNDASEQYGPVGSMLPLLSYQKKLLTLEDGITESGSLTKLLAGWTEDGETVPWFYEVTNGRHFLEPLPTVDLDAGLYQVELLNRWMDPDLTVYAPGENSSWDSKYVQLQTLTHYKGATTYDEDYNDYLETLTVPDLIQSVEMLYQPCLAVGTLQLPDSVFYVDTSGAVPSALDYTSGMMVKDAYEVSENNPRYTAVDGLLYNKEETVIEGVPTGRTELTVPLGVAQVKLPYGSHLKTVTLDLFDAEFRPEIDYSRLPGTCRIEVEDYLMDDFLRSAADDLKSTTLHVSSIEDPDHSYRIRDDLALDDDGMLHLVLTSAKRWTDLPDYVHGLEANSLRDSSIVTLMLPQSQDNTSFTFAPGCFEQDDDLKVIGCYTPAQYEAAVAAVEAAGKTALIDVVKMYDEEDDAAEGWAYLEDGAGKILLLKAPDTLTLFDGTIPLTNGESIRVDAIADGVFKDHDNLVWVDLPDNTTAIGYQAFKGCYNLQGVLIGKAPSITIGQQAFDDCPNLRFVASNAAYGDIECDDFALTDPSYGTGYLYCLETADGYGYNWTHFDVDDNIQEYRLEDCGGTKALYGATDGDSWLLIRGGGTVEDTLDLLPSTEIVFSTAFKDARATNGVFTVNWDEQGDYLSTLGYASFESSDVGVNITMPEEVIVGDYAFYSCNNLVSIEFPGWDVPLYRNVLTFCSNLQSVTYGSVDYSTGLWTNSFYGCDNLESITFLGRQAPQLVLNDAGISFAFNGSWYTEEEEAEHLHIYVPEDYQEDYIEAWRSAMLGYPDSSTMTGYQSLWNDVRTELIKANGVVPTDDEIRAEVDGRLLSSENRIRRLMGLDPVTEIGHRYSYTIDSNGDITLTGARGVEYTELTSAELELPEGKGLSYIGSLAFADSPDLRSVFLPEELKGIWNDAFKGVKFDEDDSTDGLMIIRSGDSIPQLLLTLEGTPFSFGVDDSRVEVVDLFAGSIDYDGYIQAWTLPMTGYSNLENLRNAVIRKLTIGTVAPSEEAVEAEMEIRLRKAENRVRSLLPGCSELAESDPVTFKWQDQDTAVLSLTEEMATPETAAALPIAPEPTPAPTETPAETLPDDTVETGEADETENADTEPEEDSETEPDTSAPETATPETAQTE